MTYPDRSEVNPLPTGDDLASGFSTALEASLGRRALAGGVVVMVKQRRAVTKPEQASPEAATRGAECFDHGLKQPRVFRVDPVSEGDRVEDAGNSIGDAAQIVTSPPIEPGVRRRRRSIDASHAPGKVTTIHFDVPRYETPATKCAEVAAQANTFVLENDDYARVMAGLNALRTTIRTALAAQRIRFLP